MEKKRMMDEVKSEIMQKQMQLKEAKNAQRLLDLDHRKHQNKLKHEWSNVEIEKRK